MHGKPKIHKITPGAWMAWVLALGFGLAGGVGAAEESAKPGRTVTVPSVRTGMAPMSAAAAPGPGVHDPAAQNAGVNPADTANKPESFTVTWEKTGGGGNAKTATVGGQVPDMLYAATEDVLELTGTVRKAKIKFTSTNPKPPTSDYKVICSRPILYRIGAHTIYNTEYCDGSCQPVLGVATFPFALGTTYNIPPGRHNFQLTHKGAALTGRAVPTTIVTVQITKPHGNPANSPATAADYTVLTSANANLGNELVFTSTFPDPANNIQPTCTVACTAAATLHADKLRWEIVNQTGAPAPTWHYTNAVGNTAAGPKGEGNTNVRAVYSGLFTQNSHFGKRKVKLTIDLPGLQNEMDETEVELFFLRDASNHPGNVGVPVNSRTPNWFYYWRQLCPDANVHYVRNLAQSGRVPAMVSWKYTDVFDKSRIEISGRVHPGKFSGYGNLGNVYSGIDRFLATVIHEKKHVEQIVRCDAYLQGNTGAAFNRGWSWNHNGGRGSATSHNHWNVGPDKKWGKDGIDDDGNGVIDDAKLPAGDPAHGIPVGFEPGWPNSDDECLSRTDAQYDWPHDLPPPAEPKPGLRHRWYEEDEAIKHSNDSITENDFAVHDWGKPGKQSLTINNWLD